MITGIYHSIDPCEVYIDNQPLPLKPSLKYLNWSSYGFRWGFGCVGSTQFAFALLLHMCGAADAMKYFQMLSSDVIDNLPMGEGRSIMLREGDIKNFVARKKALHSKSKLKILYWNLFSKFIFSVDFYERYIKPNIQYEDWWSLRPFPVFLGSS